MGLFDKLFSKKTEKGENMKVEPAGMKAHAPMASASKVKDPVCGMDVDPKTAPARSEHMGKNYYFCAPACKKTFDANPAKYTGGGGHEMAGHGGGHHQM